MSLESLLIHSIAIYRNSPQSDGQGGYTENLVLKAKTPGRVMTMRANEIMAMAQRYPKVSNKVFLPWGTDVLEGDVLIASYGTTDQMRVANVTSPSKSGHHLEVLCEKLAANVINASTPTVS